jgi:hypothetical protein
MAVALCQCFSGLRRHLSVKFVLVRIIAALGPIPEFAPARAAIGFP